MENIPKPLLKKLVLTFLAGIGCFFIGLIFSLAGKDRTLFALSSAVFLFSLAKGILFYRQIKSGAYGILEGTCTEISSLPFRKACRAVFTDKDGVSHALFLPKSQKVSAGRSYRIYLQNPFLMPDGMPSFLQREYAADSLLGWRRPRMNRRIFRKRQYKYHI